MKNILGKLLLASMMGSLIVLVSLIQLTSPASAGAVGILVVFISAYVLIVTTSSFFMYGVSRVVVKVSRLFVAKKPLEAMSLRKSYYYSSVVGLAPVILVGMESVGTLGVYEVSLVVLLVAIGCVYVTKRIA